MTIALVGFVMLFRLCLAGILLAIGMLFVDACGFAWVCGWDARVAMSSQQVLDMATSHGMSVIPLFMLMGAFVHRAGLSTDLFAAARNWLGAMRGGLAHPTWFGILVVKVADLGLNTPSVGMNVVVVKSLAPEVSTWRILAGAAPYVVTNVVFVVILLSVPALALWLPGFMK